MIQKTKLCDVCTKVNMKLVYDAIDMMFPKTSNLKQNLINHIVC